MPAILVNDQKARKMEQENFHKIYIHTINNNLFGL